MEDETEYEEIVITHDEQYQGDVFFNVIKKKGYGIQEMCNITMYMMTLIMEYGENLPEDERVSQEAELNKGRPN